MFVLSVELDESLRHIAQRARGRQRTLDERSAPPLAGDLPSEDHLVPVGRVLEDGFDGGLELASPHQIGGRTGPQQEPDSLHEDRLAGARLTREDVEPRVELDLDGFDDSQVPDAEEAQHVDGTPIVSYV